MVGQAANFLLIDFMTHLRPAKHDLDARPQGFKQAHHLGGFHHVPYIDTQADDRRIQRQQLLDNLQRALLNDKFTQLGAGPQPRAAMPVHICQQAAQPERGMNVFGV